MLYYNSFDVGGKTINNFVLYFYKEFSEIQCCYLGTEKELAPLFPTRYLFQVVILAYIRWNSFHSITQPCIIFEFFAIHVPLDFRTFMRCFGCYYFCNLLKDLRLALILLRTAHAERKRHTDCLVSYKNSFSVHGRLDIGGLLFPLR